MCSSLLFYQCLQSDYFIALIFYTFYLLQSVLLEDHMRELRRVIRPGNRRLNWNSLGINDFVQRCISVSMLKKATSI